MKKAAFSAACVLATALAAVPAEAKPSDTDGQVVIGVVADMSGVYSAHGGKGELTAVQMAVEDFGGKVGDKPIKVLSADYQLKVDIGLGTVKRWLENDAADVIVEGTDSATAAGLFDLSKTAKTIVIAASAASTSLHNEHCSPYGIHYVYDTYALATGTGAAMVAEGGKSWFFITADYAFGHSLEANTSRVVEANGGEVLGHVRVPLSTSDFSSYVLQAQASGAQVVGLANAGADFVNSTKQANEFGIVAGGQKLAAMLVFITDVKALGLDIAQGLTFTLGYYWDRDDESRAFADRYMAKTGARPSMVQAGAYSATMHYLKAVEAVGSEDADAVSKWMKEHPINDFFTKNGVIREDGRMVHDMYLAEAKAPSESKNDWDLVKILRTIPGDQAFMPLSESSCPLIKK